MSDSNRRPTTYKAVALPLSQSGINLYMLVEMIGIEPIVTEVGRFTVSCHTVTAASPKLG